MYVLSSDQILVMNELGKILRKIPVHKTAKSELATKLVVSDGLAAVWLETDPANGTDIGLTLETIDLNTGRVSGIYSPSEELGTNAVAFSREDGFVFFRNVNSRINVLTASIR